MKIAIIGYGKMGKEIEELALRRGHQIKAIIDNEEDWQKQNQALKEAEMAIEFSMPGTAANNILRCFDLGLDVVSGTTAWDASFEHVKSTCISKNRALFYASNFSPGMNIVFELNRKLAIMMSRQDAYNIQIEETHHKAKKDQPSGTAITLANDIIDINPEKMRWLNETVENKEELEIISIRKDQVPGTHSIQYDSDIDSIEIRHTAHSRKGFALGALLATEWLPGRKGCFGMQDLLNDIK